MIDDQTKKKLLDELEKTGNVWSSCAKINIHRSTVYRWRENDGRFCRAMDKACRIGRQNMNDLAEHALMINVKERKQRAIEYQLSHRHPAYRTKPPSTVIIQHIKQPIQKIIERTAEDQIDEFFEQGKYAKKYSSDSPSLAPKEAGKTDDSGGGDHNNDIPPVAENNTNAQNSDT